MMALTSGGVAQTPVGVPGNWTLTFQDEFNGTTLDGTKWRMGTHHVGIAGSGGNAPGNITASAGTLKLKSEQRAVSYGGKAFSYATGEVSTFFNYRQQYGYMEARIKYPAVKGLWPAFWLMPDRGDYGWGGAYRRSFLKFDLTGVNPGTISSASLKLKVSSFESGGENNVVLMKVADDSWTESTITWNNKPTPDPVWLGQRYNQPYTVGSEVTFDVTGYVAQEMAGDKRIGFALADTFMRTKLISFHSREAVNAADRPQLIINGVAYTATEDSSVRWGSSYEGVNHGSAATLDVKDDWGNTSTTYNGGMEIDVMETLGIWGDNVNSHTLHWDGYGTDHKTTGWGKIPFPAIAGDFHTYGVYWEAGRLVFYIDGVQTGEYVSSRVMNVPAYFILSLQLGGWDGNTPGSQVHNQTVEVDYVRAWNGTRTAPVSSVPSPWTTADLGAVSAGGLAMHSAGVFSVHGSGNDIAGTADAFRFVRQSISGDFDISARVTFQTNTNGMAKAGVMVREDLTPGSRYALMAATPATNGFRFSTRTAVDAAAVSTGSSLYTAPNNWVRLQRVGNTLTAFKSSNGTTWSQVGSPTTISMGSSVYVGLASSSNVTGSLSRALFDNVTVAPITAPSGPLLAHYNFDVASGTFVNQGSGGTALNLTNTGGAAGRDGTGSGGYGATGYSGYGTAFDVLASGDNTYHTATSSIGGGALTASNVAQSALQGSDGAFTYEALISISTTAGEQNILSHDGDVTRGFLFRVNAGTLSFYDGTASFSAPIPTTGTHAFVANNWYHVAVAYNGSGGTTGNLKLYWTKLGAGASSANQIGTATVAADLSGSVSNKLGAGTTTRFPFRYELRGLIDEVRITNAEVAASAFPVFVPTYSLTSGDIGSVGLAGTTSHSGGLYSIQAAGADISGGTDSFHFARMAASGDCDIRVRVTSQENTNAWAKAGVMVRESTSTGARYVMMMVTPGNGFRLQKRITQGAWHTTYAGGSLNTAPNNWVRVTRVGNVFTGYTSVDGVNWTQVDVPQEFTMNSSTLIGLAVTSRDTTQLCTATFDNLTITP